MNILHGQSATRAWLSWGIATLFVIFQFFLQTSAGVMAHLWKFDFHINALSIANLSAAFFYAYVFMQIPAGLIYDRYNPRIVLTSAASVLALGCFIFSGTDNYYIAFFSRMLMGTGAAFGFVGMLQISTLWFTPTAFPIMVSLAETIGALSTVGSEILLAWLVVHFGWRYTIFYASITAILIGLFAFIIIKNKSPTTIKQKTTQKAESIWKTLFQLSKHKQVWIIGIYGFFSFTLINVFTSLWGIPFLLLIYHFDLHTAAQMLSVVFLGISLGTLMLSWISMKMGRRIPMMFIGALISAILISILLFVPNLSQHEIYALLFFSGLSSSCYVLCFTLVKEIVPASYRAAALAMINMLMMISAPLLQPLLGLFISHNFFHLAHSITLTYQLSLAILPIGFVINTILVFFMQESYCQEYTQNEAYE